MCTSWASGSRCCSLSRTRGKQEKGEQLTRPMQSGIAKDCTSCGSGRIAQGAEHTSSTAWWPSAACRCSAHPQVIKCQCKEGGPADSRVQLHIQAIEGGIHWAIHVCTHQLQRPAVTEPSEATDPTLQTGDFTSRLASPSVTRRSTCAATLDHFSHVPCMQAQ